MFKMTKACIVLLVLIFMSGCGGQLTGIKEEVPKKQNNKIEEQAVIPYEIIHTVTNKRFDKGINLYVLVKPGNYQSDESQESVKKLINKLVKEKGPKISIDFFDDKKVLEVHYDKWITRKLKPSENDNKLLDEHYIASFSGDLSTGPYKNTFFTFPSRSAKGMEYNPKY